MNTHWSLHLRDTGKTILIPKRLRLVIMNFLKRSLPHHNFKDSSIAMFIPGWSISLHLRRSIFRKGSIRVLGLPFCTSWRGPNLRNFIRQRYIPLDINWQQKILGPPPWNDLTNTWLYEADYWFPSPSISWEKYIYLLELQISTSVRSLSDYYVHLPQVSIKNTLQLFHSSLYIFF